jgi:hypothetical protein
MVTAVGQSVGAWQGRSQLLHLMCIMYLQKQHCENDVDDLSAALRSDQSCVQQTWLSGAVENSAVKVYRGRAKEGVLEQPGWEGGGGP